MKSFIKDHYHWVTVALCCGLSGTVLGVSSNSMGVFYLPVARELGVGVGDAAAGVGEAPAGPAWKERNAVMT